MSKRSRRRNRRSSRSEDQVRVKTTRNNRRPASRHGEPEGQGLSADALTAYALAHTAISYPIPPIRAERGSAASSSLASPPRVRSRSLYKGRARAEGAAKRPLPSTRTSTASERPKARSMRRARHQLLADEQSRTDSSDSSARDRRQERCKERPSRTEQVNGSIRRRHAGGIGGTQKFIPWC